MEKLGLFKKVQCACRECISSCEWTPGWFRPREISPLAEFFDLSVMKVFKKYLIADFWRGDLPQNIYVLTPIKYLDHPLRLGVSSYRDRLSSLRKHNGFMGKDDDRAGSRASYDYAFLHAPCIFLKDSKCEIYPVRPFECAVAWHNGNPKTHKNIREPIAEEWEHSSLISYLLNCKARVG